MGDAILVLNVGSSSVKFALFGVENGGHRLPRRCRGEIDGIGTDAWFAVTSDTGGPPVREPLGVVDHARALARLLAWLQRETSDLTLIAAGHRVVHGGSRFAAPALLDAGVLQALEALVPMAPLHQPHNVAGIRAVMALRPDLPQVVCFDTQFHRTQPWVAETFALPRDFTDAGIKRYGFHGLSYEYVASVLPAVAGPAAEGRVVVAHLGAGASMCAMRGRQSVATTMGLTALDGLPMGTRCGSLDPGVLLYLLRERGMSVDELTDLLYHQSGLLGVSGKSGDMRELLASDATEAREAVDLFVYRVGRELGSLAAALGGLDALVFTGGIGERAAPIRARVMADARWLGLRLDAAANARHGPRISTPDSHASAWVIPTDEERMIARHTFDHLHKERHP